MKKLNRTLLAIFVFASLYAEAADFTKLGTAAVLNVLKDPESARFKATFVNNRNYCGEVNSKNSYGGYTGFKRFIALSSVVATIEDSDDKDGLFDDLWRKHCYTALQLKAYQKRQTELEAVAKEDQEQHNTVVNMTAEQQRAELRKQGEERESGRADGN